MTNEPSEIKLVEEEILKENSNFLRGTLKKELAEESAKFNGDNSKLLKFHGIYQQDDRDLRKKLLTEKKEKAYSLMIRTKLPGGKLAAKQYLILDSIADQYTNKTLRLTTRQTIQYHGVLKKNIKKTVQEINKLLINSYGACGDVVRNVMAPPVSDIDSDYPEDLIKTADEISNYFLPESRAYYEVWLEDENGERISDGIERIENESIYGKTYLPRKFKIGIGTTFDNSTDIFTQDIGIVAIINNNKIDGFNVYVGGGLGHHHNKPETYPRLASPLCFCDKKDLLNITEKIVEIQRDFGCRENRKHARFKYLIDDKGLDWFKEEIEKRLGFKLNPVYPVNEFKSRDYLGWHKQKNGDWYLGIFVENGRLKDQEKIQTKSGIRKIVEKFSCNVRISPQQNIILCDIKEKDKIAIDDIISDSGFYVYGKTLSNLRRNSIACVSMPTCSLAIAEAERFLPSLITELENMGYGGKEVTIRISGCPNSCSRAPVAQIGMIGTSLNKYNLYSGGEFNGTKLNKIAKENVSSEDLAKEIGKLIDLLKES